MILGGSFFRPRSPVCAFSTTSRAASSRSREMGMLQAAISVFKKVLQFLQLLRLGLGKLGVRDLDLINGGHAGVPVGQDAAGEPDGPEYRRFPLLFLHRDRGPGREHIVLEALQLRLVHDHGALGVLEALGPRVLGRQGRPAENQEQRQNKRIATPQQVPKWEISLMI